MDIKVGSLILEQVPYTNPSHESSTTVVTLKRAPFAPGCVAMAAVASFHHSFKAVEKRKEKLQKNVSSNRKTTSSLFRSLRTPAHSLTPPPLPLPLLFASPHLPTCTT